MILVLITCLIGIITSAPVSRTTSAPDDDDDDDDDIRSVNVSEGENITISILVGKLDTDPQILVIRIKNSSDYELIAQVICHNEDCEYNTSSGTSLFYDGQNVTLKLLNVIPSQTGLYEIKELSSAQIRIYNITVIKSVSALSSKPPPPVMSSQLDKAVAITVAVLVILVLIAGVTPAICCLCRKKKYGTVSQQDNSAASSKSESLNPEIEGII